MSVTYSRYSLPRSDQSLRPDDYVPEHDAPCLLCESTEGERERVGNWVWCLFPTPCRQRRKALERARKSIHRPQQG